MSDQSVQTLFNTLINNQSETVLNNYSTVYFSHLNDNFPSWKDNKYLKERKDLKHTFFKLVSKSNYQLLSKIMNITNF